MRRAAVLVGILGLFLVAATYFPSDDVVIFRGGIRGAVQDKGGQVYNVLAYGLVGDGVVDTDGGPNGEPGDCTQGTDNSPALNALLEKIRLAGEATTIHFPGGIYRFDSTIEIKGMPPIMWQGSYGFFTQDANSAASGTVLLNCADGILLKDTSLAYGGRTTIAQKFRDFAIQCNNQAADVGIALWNGYDSEGFIENLYFGDCYQHIAIGDPVTGSGNYSYEISRCRFFNNDYTTGTAIYMDPHAQGAIKMDIHDNTIRQHSKCIDFQAKSAIWLHHNIIESCRNGGLSFMNGGEIIVEDNHFENHANDSGYDVWIQDRDEADCIAAGGTACTLATACADGSNCCCDGGTLDGYKCSCHPETTFTFTRNTLGGRYVYTTDSVAIKFENDFISLNHIVIEDNTFSGGNYWNVQLGATNGATTAHFRGNNGGRGYDFTGGGTSNFNGKVCVWSDSAMGGGIHARLHGCYFPNGIAAGVWAGWTLASAASVSIAQSPVFRLTGTTPITNFIDGDQGQCITMYADNDGVVVADVDGTIDLSGDTNATLNTGDTLSMCMFEAGNWFETARTQAARCDQVVSLITNLTETYDSTIFVSVNRYTTNTGLTLVDETTEGNVDTFIVPRTAVVHTLRVESDAAPGTGDARAFYLRDDGVSTAVGCTELTTIPTCSDLTHSATMAANSRVNIVLDNMAGGSAPDDDLLTTISFCLSYP